MEIYYTPTVGLLNNPHLYSTVRASLVDINTNEVIKALYDKAAQYEKCIANAMAAFQTVLHPTNNLMAYFELSDNAAVENQIKQKVLSACPTVCAVRKELYAVLELELADDLTDTELHTFVNQIRSQYEYGWGEEFEEQNILTDTGEEAVCPRLFHNDIDFCTASAFERFKYVLADSVKEKDCFDDGQILSEDSPLALSMCRERSNECLIAVARRKQENEEFKYTIRM